MCEFGFFVVVFIYSILNDAHFEHLSNRLVVNPELMLSENTSQNELGYARIT